jgi:hypothetical protein
VAAATDPSPCIDEERGCCVRRVARAQHLRSMLWRRLAPYAKEHPNNAIDDDSYYVERSPWLCIQGTCGRLIPSSISSGRVDLSETFTFFFLMLGPINVLGPFVKMTKRADDRFRRQLAIRATIFSCFALAAAALVGERSLRDYGVSLNVADDNWWFGPLGSGIPDDPPAVPTRAQRRNRI